MNELTHLSLFSGIGGLDIAAEWAGFETVGQCEWADYPRAVLEKHWPGLPRWRDIRTLTKESFYEQTGLQSVTVLSGGFPCQPFSTAGKRRGKEDDRYLWPEMLRVIQDIQPRWVVGENVAGIVSMELDTVLSDLEAIGYTCQAFVIPACAVDAPHRRDRIAMVAYASGDGRKGLGIQSSERCNIIEKCSPFTEGCDVPYTYSKGFQIAGHKSKIIETKPKDGVALDNRRSTEPGLGGMADGLSRWLDEPAGIPRVRTGVKDRVGRLKCLGNAVVPQQFYPIFRAIAEIERR